MHMYELTISRENLNSDSYENYAKFETGLIVRLQWNFNLKINGSVKTLLHKSTVVVCSGYELLVLFSDLQVPCSAGFHT